MQALLAAFRFLTVLPIPGGGDTTPEAIARCGRAFPAVGVLLGAAMWLLATGLAMVVPQPVAALAIVAAGWLVTGGLHLDGLADTADGFFSARPRDRIIEIMKDSHTGAMGVAAIVFVLVGKVVCVASVEPQVFAPAAAMAVLAGRCVMLIAMVAQRPANPDGGLGAMFLRNRSPWEAVFALAVMGVGGYALLGWAGVIAAGVAVAIVPVMAIKSHRRIGGATGDTIGATCELVELVTVATLTLPALTCLRTGAWLIEYVS